MRSPRLSPGILRQLAPVSGNSRRNHGFQRRSGVGRVLAAVTVAGIGALTGASAAHAQITLSHITTYEVDSSGDASLAQTWDTMEDNASFDVFIIQGSDVSGTILNSGPIRELSLPLSLGSNTFTLLMEKTELNPNGGLSLFFNGADAPGISAYSPFSTTATPPTSGFGKIVYNPYPYPGGPQIDGFPALFGPGAALTFAGPGGTTATLTSLTFFNSGVNRVYIHDAVADGLEDFGVTFTLNVAAVGTAAPEPSALALLAPGLPLAGMVLRRRQRKP